MFRVYILTVKIHWNTYESWNSGAAISNNQMIAPIPMRNTCRQVSGNIDWWKIDAITEKYSSRSISQICGSSNSDQRLYCMQVIYT